jgi:hypothetical protein
MYIFHFYLFHHPFIQLFCHSLTNYSQIKIGKFMKKISKYKIENFL